MSTKTCTTCHLDKPLVDFNKLRNAPDGHAYRCRVCAVQQGRLDYARNPDMWKDAARRWKAKNPERVKEIAKKCQDKRKLSPEKRRESYLATRRWIAKNREFEATRSALRKAVKRSRVTHWDRELELLVDKEAQVLRISREKETGFAWHLDHVIPLRAKLASGLHNPFNLAVVPASYNCKKRNAFDPENINPFAWILC